MNEKDKLNQNAAEQTTNANRTKLADFLLAMPNDNEDAFAEWADKLNDVDGPNHETMLDITDEIGKHGVNEAFVAVRDDFKAGKISEEAAFYKLAFLYQAANFVVAREENSRLRLSSACALWREMDKQILSLTDKMQLCIDYIYENADNPTECAKALAAIDHLNSEIARGTTDEGFEKYVEDIMNKLTLNAISEFAKLIS